MDRGTLYQLRNLINRRNVTTHPKSDVNANEDFLEVCITSYILVAVMSHLGMSALDDTPLHSVISHGLWMEDDTVRRSALTEIASSIVDKHVDLAAEFASVSEFDGDEDEQEFDPSNSDGSSVYEYTREVLSLGLLYLAFKDAVREGDGDRVMVIWKYFMLLFRATGHTNYTLEALTLLTQYFTTLPPNLAEQLKWCRFINVHGKPQCNISCDLQMEHMNRTVKTAIEGLGANKSERAIVRVGRSVGTFTKMLERFDREAGVASVSGKRSEASMEKDVQEIVTLLSSEDVFCTSRSHKSFPKLKSNLIRKLEEKSVRDWILGNFSKYTL